MPNVLIRLAPGRGQGCREMASDAYIDNHLSQRAHEALAIYPIPAASSTESHPEVP